MNEWWHETVVKLLENILVVGAVVTAIGIGIKRIYSVARSVEKILEFTVQEKKAREEVSQELKRQIELQKDHNHTRDIQIGELVETVREISREMRPNGGSSMKDVLNHTAERVGDIQTRVAVLEEWKRTAPCLLHKFRIEVQE
jgi:NTP pyrophosphatase (non-canonical NTP hydrolase)